MNPTNNFFQKILNAVIRPPRASYDINAIPIYFQSNDEHTYVRYPINFVNRRKEKIVGSIYTDSSRNVNDGGPCVIFVHGNSSCQNEGRFLIPNLCKYNISVFLYDCAGCGNSGGDYVSLGYYESKDLEFIIEQLKISFGMGPFILWGRSMGAATSLMANNDNIKGIIADSAFASLNLLFDDLSEKLQTNRLLCSLAIWYLKLKIKELVGYDSEAVTPIEYAKLQNKAPCIIGHSYDDELIPFHHGKLLFDAYSNTDKQFVTLENSHNSVRSGIWYDTCFKFIFRILGIQVNDFRRCIFRGVIPKMHFNSYQEIVDFCNKNGGEDKSLMLLTIESNLDCIYE